MEIYLITDLTNGKQYVGQTINTKEERFRTHLSGNLYIDHVIRKRGNENIKLETLEKIKKQERLDVREKYWIKKLNTIVPNGYNLTKGGNDRSNHNITEFNINDYLKSIFYPKNNLGNTPNKLKVCYIHLSSLYALLSMEQFELCMDSSRFNISSVFTDDELVSLSYKTDYFPSISYFMKHIPEEFHRNIYMRLIQTALQNRKLIKVYDEDEYFCSEEENNIVAFFTTPSDEEYDLYAENTINDLKNKLINNVDLLNDFITLEYRLKNNY